MFVKVLLMGLVLLIISGFFKEIPLVGGGGNSWWNYLFPDWQIQVFSSIDPLCNSILGGVYERGIPFPFINIWTICGIAFYVMPFHLVLNLVVYMVFGWVILMSFKKITGK